MKEIIKVKWDTGLNLLVVQERAFFHEQDLKHFLMKLTKNLDIPFSRCKVLLAKDGYLVWYPEDRVLKFILDMVASAIAGFKGKIEGSPFYRIHIDSLKKTGFKPDDEDYLYFIKKRILYFFKRGRKTSLTINEFIERLKSLYELIEHNEAYADKFVNIGEQFIRGLQEGKINLTDEQKHQILQFTEFEMATYHVKEDFLKYVKNKKLTTDKFFDYLIEYFEREVEGIDDEEEGFISSKRICLHCLEEFTPKKGDKALYCPFCYLKVWQKIKKRIQRHKDKVNIRKYLALLKSEKNLANQRKIITQLKKRFSEIFN